MPSSKGTYFDQPLNGVGELLFVPIAEKYATSW